MISDELCIGESQDSISTSYLAAKAELEDALDLGDFKSWKVEITRVDSEAS